MDWLVIWKLFITITILLYDFRKLISENCNVQFLVMFQLSLSSLQARLLALWEIAFLKFQGRQTQVSATLHVDCHLCSCWLPPGAKMVKVSRQASARLNWMVPLLVAGDRCCLTGDIMDRATDNEPIQWPKNDHPHCILYKKTTDFSFEGCPVGMCMVPRVRTPLSHATMPCIHSEVWVNDQYMQWKKFLWSC